MKRMLIVLIVLLPVCLFSQSLSLELIGSSGDQVSTGNGKLDYACGEIAVQSSGRLTEGLLQGVLKTSFQRNETPPLLTVTVFPNPVAHSLHFSKDFPASVSASVFSAGGQLIRQVSLDGERTSLDCSDWVPGLYLIRFSHTDFQFQPVKISKH